MLKKMWLIPFCVVSGVLILSVLFGIKSGIRPLLINQEISFDAVVLTLVSVEGGDVTIKYHVPRSGYYSDLIKLNEVEASTYIGTHRVHLVTSFGFGALVRITFEPPV